MNWKFKARRTATKAIRRVRLAREFVRAFLSTEHPILVQIVPTRNCNLSCAYCNEWDHKKVFVPLPEMRDRIRKLAELGSASVALSGGEPMTHPDCIEIIRCIRENGMYAGMITDGFFLNEKVIAQLNEAGLDEIQISIDNVLPDNVSKKSLKTLRPKLKMLSELATFEVRINSVVGGGTEYPTDAWEIALEAKHNGFNPTVGIIHEDAGQLKPLNVVDHSVYTEIAKLSESRFPPLRAFQRLVGIRKQQDNLAAGKPNNWSCRAGARYLYVDEFGNVQLCSQTRRGPSLNKPLLQYTADDIRKWYLTPKACAPMCTVGCVHRVSRMDFFRGYQHLTETRP